jgi:hypothetical protein
MQSASYQRKEPNKVVHPQWILGLAKTASAPIKMLNMIV